MANRIPLIVDQLDSNKLKELPVGDNLDLGGAGVTNAGVINATDVRINNVSFNNPFSGDYNDLTNKPTIPTVPSAISAFANDRGYLESGITTDAIPDVEVGGAFATNRYFTNSLADARINEQTGANLDLNHKIISDLKNVESVTSADDGKILFYDHASVSWKWKVDAGGVTLLRQLTDVDAVTSVDNDKILYYDHATTSYKWRALSSSFTFRVGADDSTLRTINSDESIKFVGGTGITTASDTEGNITIQVGAIGDLTDVAPAGVTDGQALLFNSGTGVWTPGDISSFPIGNLTDVDTTTVTPVDEAVLSWDVGTSKWEPRLLDNVNAATVTSVADATALAHSVTFVASGTGSGQDLRTDASLTYNPNTNVLSATSVNTTTLTATNINVSGSVANGVNEVTFATDIKLASANEIRFYDTDNTNFSSFKAPANLTSNTTFTLPDGDGTTGAVMQTNGAGTLSWTHEEHSFQVIAVSGQTDIVADSAADTLTFVAGTNVTLTTDASTDAITINSTGGGGGTPGGADTQVQFNDATTFGGDAGLVYNKTTDTLTGVNITSTGTLTVNNFTATGTLTADIIETSGTGVPTFTSASNLILDAASAVVIQRAPLRLGSFDTNGVAGLVGNAGEIIYNSSEKQLKLFDGTSWIVPDNGFSFTVGADDSTLRTISKDEGIKFTGGSGIDTTSDTEGNITIASSGPTITYTVTANGSSAYRFAGPGIDGTTDNPNLSLYKGFTYIFINSAGGSHPFAIRVSNGGADFSEGVTGSQTGTQTFVPQHDTSDSALVYQCTIHAGMVGNLTIV
jgi:hypothetical protein